MYKKVKRGNSRPLGLSRENSFRRKVKDIFFSNKNTYHKIDYAQKREYLSPRTRQRKLSGKKKIEILLLSIFVISFFSFVAFHPFFSITKVNVSGLNRINKAEFTQSVFNVMSCKKVFVFSCKSYIFVDVDEVYEVIFDKYSLDSLSIKKIFPNTIEVDLEEKISTIIYDDGKTYSFVDLNGQYVETIENVLDDEWYTDETISTSTTNFKIGDNRFHKPNSKRIYNDIGNYPLVFDDREEKSNTDIIIKPEYVGGLIDWYNYFNKSLAESINYFTLLNSVGDVSIKTYSGWEVIVRLGERFGSQSDQLKYLLEKEINGKYFNYIELRYPDRAYWK